MPKDAGEAKRNLEYTLARARPKELAHDYLDLDSVKGTEEAEKALDDSAEAIQARAREAEAITDRQKSQRCPIFDPAPDTAGEEKRENQCGRTEADKIPDAHVAKPGLDGEEDDRAEDRALKGSQSPD